MYRFYNPHNGEHFYTPNKEERDELLKNDQWRYEGEGWLVPFTSDYPVYRLLDPTTGDHRYTMDINVYDRFQTLGWIGEGIGHYSVDPKDPNIVQLYHLSNPNAKEAGSEHYTADQHERDVLIAKGWKYEGIVGYGLKELSFETYLIFE
ncbi:MAG: hypothetical protein HDR44_00460 [Allobaculum sp.]|nr:hypothetical protein [Allobaculum sp.]MDE5757388.1 hypothetical protein [Allobaculum sp.]